MYYGNPKAADGGDARATYDPDQVLVYHFAERGTPAQDETGYANHSRTTAASDDAALIGSGIRLDGRSSLVVPDAPSSQLVLAAPSRGEAWVSPTAPTGVLYSRHDGAASLVIGLTDGSPYVSVTGSDGAARRSPVTQPLGEKGWHHLAVVATAERATLYVDGKPGPEVEGPLPALTGPATLGADSQAPSIAGFAGTVDELQIARVARDPAPFESPPSIRGRAIPSSSTARTNNSRHGARDTSASS